MDLACCSAIRTRVASMVTRPSPCFRRKSEIIAADDDSAAARPPNSRARERKMAEGGLICFRLPCDRRHANFSVHGIEKSWSIGIRVNKMITDSKAANRLAGDRNVGQARGRLCQLICL